MPSTETPSSRSLRVLVVDDHPAIRAALSNIIDDETGMEVIGVVGTEAEAKDLAGQADVAVIDIILESTNGLVLLEALRQQHPHLQAVVFSMHDEMVFGEPALRSGASSYLMKVEPTQRVIEAIRRVARGELYVSSKLGARLLGSYFRQDRLPPTWSDGKDTEPNSE